MSQYQAFETGRLLLRPTTEADAAFILELLNTSKWLKYIGDRGVYNLEDAKEYIRTKITRQLERLGYANYTVIRKVDGVKMGSCGLYDREGLEGVDIGFAFLPDYEGQGYAFESASKIKELAFNNFGLHQLNAITMPANTASRRLLEKLGFTSIKTVKLPNDPEDLLLYRLEVTY